MKCVFLFITSLSFLAQQDDWLTQQENGFVLHYHASDKEFITGYVQMMQTGRKAVQAFFDNRYRSLFEIYIHPGRASLDSTWQKDWNMPQFRSECWMVASGVASRLDLLSLQQWRSQSCEHDERNRAETQQLLTHELVHVYHGQINPGKDFSATDKLDWFVEGLAAYVSGQINQSKRRQVREAITENKIPSSLDDFWKGSIRYQLSGCLVRYIDKTWGRKKLAALLRLTTKQSLLAALHVKEAELIAGWKQFEIKGHKTQILHPAGLTIICLSGPM